jgi:membrane protein required for colicin V production
MNLVSNINLVDVAVVLLLIYFSYRGFICGFFNILFDALAVIVSFYAANQYFVLVKQLLAEHLSFNVPWSGFASYILVYMTSFLFFILWGRIITRIFRMSTMGLFNSVAGLALNFLKWSLLIFIGVLFLEKITIVTISKYINDSYVFQTYQNVFALDFLKEFVPKF